MDSRRRLKALPSGIFVHEDDGTVWPWHGYSTFLAYKFWLEYRNALRAGEAARAALWQAKLDRTIADSGPFNVLRVWLMTCELDGGKVDTPDGYTGRLEDLPDDPDKQLWPQHYGEDFYSDLAPFVEHCADRGKRVEFTVFANSRRIMPDPTEQQQHLDRVTAILEPLPSVFLEVANEPGIDLFDVYRIRPTRPGRMLWATGDYDMERIDVMDGDRLVARDPRSAAGREAMAMGTYITIHGKRESAEFGIGASLVEGGKEGHFYKGGWDVRNHEGHRSYGIACRRPIVQDEGIAAAAVAFNRWGDARYTDPEHARILGALHKLSQAGGTFHSESGCTSAPLTANERACARAYHEGLTMIDSEAVTWPYEHDRTAGHLLAPVPHLGGDDYAAAESVSRANGPRGYAATVLIKGDYQPEGQHGWRVVERAGRGGGLMRLERAS